MYFKLLIYGHEGSGKTRFAADAPKPQWFDWENSTQTLRNIPEYEHLAKNAITYPDPIEMFNHVRRCVRDPDIETIVIDSMSSATETNMIDFMEEQSKPSPGKKTRNEFVRFDTDYGPGTNVFNKLFTRLQTAKINVIIIAHQREDRASDREGLVTKIYPDVTPAIRRTVKRLVDFCGYLEISKTASSTRPAERRLYVNPTHLIEAKNRFDFQQTYFDNPTWESVFGKVIDNGSES